MKDNAFILNVINKIEYVAEQIKALSDKGNALNISENKNIEYLRYLVLELTKNELTRFDRKRNRYREQKKKEEQEKEDVIFRKIHGCDIPIDPDTEKPVGGQIKAIGGEDNPDVKEIEENKEEEEKKKEEVRKQHPREEGSRCEDVVKYKNFDEVDEEHGRTETHFCHDEDTLYVAKDVHKVKSGDEFVTMPIGKIEHLTVFAASDLKSGVRLKDRFAKMFPNVDPDSWKHVKGVGYVIDKDGKKRLADIHWFESPEYGQFGWKVKAFVDEMPESNKYWLKEKK